MVDETNDTELQSVVLAGELMANTAGNLSAKFDTFATWLLAGFGAAVGLLLTSHEAMVVVPAATTRFGAKLFLAAVCITVVEKYLSILVAAGSEGAALSRTSIQNYFDERRELDLPIALNMQTFIREFMRPMFRPAVWIASFAIRKVAAGDLNAGVRPLVIMSQVQGGLLLVEVGLFVAAIWRIVDTLPG
jgi:hypothetical protein